MESAEAGTAISLILIFGLMIFFFILFKYGGSDSKSKDIYNPKTNDNEQIINCCSHDYYPLGNNRFFIWFKCIKCGKIIKDKMI